MYIKKNYPQNYGKLFFSLLSLIFAAIIFVNCTSTQFTAGSNNSKKKTDNANGQGNRDSGQAGNDGSNGLNNGQIFDNNGGFPKDGGLTGVKDDSGNILGQNGSDPNLSGGGDRCKYVKKWNIILVFDNSGSMIDTDPQGLRRLGAINFVQSFNNVINSVAGREGAIAVIMFSSISQASGWYNLKTELPTIEQQINIATANPEGATIYSNALNDAASLFQSIGTDINKVDQRNFVLFLTDGAPNLSAPPGIAGGATDGWYINPSTGYIPLESPDMIDTVRTTLIYQYGAAIVMIASGPRLGDMDRLSQMYQMTTGISDPNAEKIAKVISGPGTPVDANHPGHTGFYVRRNDAAATQDAFQEIFNAITDGGCK